jgi:nicotinamidase-related amidase
MMGPAKNPDLHGNVPDEAAAALLLIDVVNDLEFEGGDRLLPQALALADRLERLVRRTRAAGLPTIYVNDNLGRWQSSFPAVLAHALGPVRGAPLAGRLRPDADAYVVLKPKHSAFYATTLDVLLRYLKVGTLILTGLTGDRCVLFTAIDAFLRDFHLVVPSDCVVSIEPEHNRQALAYMARMLDADVRESDAILASIDDRPPAA